MQSSTFVIVGGGVIGLSTAYHLACKQVGRIIVLEKGTVGGGASIRAAGIISGLLWTETGVQARKISLQRYRELSEELEGYRFQDVGCINFYDSESWPSQESLLPLYDRLGVGYEILEPAEVAKRWPALTPADHLTGLYDPKGGYSEPDDYVPALANKIRELGVEVREHQQVDGFLQHKGQINGVSTQSGPIEADGVICTVHCWTVQLLEQLGWQLPMKSFVHQRFLATPMASPPAIPAVNANPLGGYVRPANGGRLLVGLETAHRLEHKIADVAFDMSALTIPDDSPGRAWSNIAPLLKDLQSLQCEDSKVGLICFSVDGEPVLGQVKPLPGLYVGTAFHSGGFAYNPAAGVLLADLVAGGKTAIDISGFSPDRFNKSDVDDYLDTTISQAQLPYDKRRH